MTASRTIRQLAATALNLVGVRFAGAAISLLTQILLARLLAEEDVGAVFLTMSATSIMGLAATLGYPALTLTVTARYRALGRSGLERSFRRLVLRDTAILTFGVWSLVAIIANVTPLDPHLRLALSFAALSLVPADLLRLNSALANTQRRFALSYMPDFLFRPGLLFAFLIVAWVAELPISATTVLWAYTSSNLLTALGQAMLMGRSGITGEIGKVRATLVSPMRSRAFALAVVFATAAAFSDVVTLVGGLFLKPDDVALLGVIVRLAALAGFVTQALQQIVLPDLAQLLVNGRETEIRRLFLRVNVISLFAILTLAIGAIAAGPAVLGLFGPAYVEGHLPLVVFMMGLAFRALGGLNQHLLSLAGKQVKTAVSSLLALALLVAGAAVLGPAWGVTGMAVSALLGEAVWAIALAIQARRNAGRRGDILGLF